MKKKVNYDLKVVTFTISDNTFNHLTFFCKKHDISKSRLMRFLLHEFFKNPEKFGFQKMIDNTDTSFY